MKNIKYLLGLFCLAIAFVACEDDFGREPGGDVSSRTPVLNLLAENKFTIAEPEADADGEYLFRSSWTRPRFSYENGLPVEVENVKYALQMGVLGEEFQNNVVIIETEELFMDVYSGKLYTLIEELLGGEFEEMQNLEFRIVATYDGNDEGLLSNSITVIVEKEAPWEPVELTIKFKQTEGSWAEFAVYAWGDAEVYGGWPGQVLTADAEGWYSFTVPTNRPINLIMNNNNNGSQFDFLTDPTLDACYEFNTNGSSWTEVDCPEFTVEEYTIKFKQSEGSWNEFAVYAWGDAEVYGGWPGQVLTADADGWYSFTVPTNRPINLIMNNNNNGSQFDFLTDPTSDACYEFNTNSGTWTAVDCPPIVIKWKYIGADWTSFGIYAWGGDPVGETFGGWPGTIATPDAEGWCSVTVPSGQTVGNVIFNNGNGGDGNQFDLNMQITESVCFEITSNSYTIVDCN